jgi:predicted lipid-binding transport protein (Tim44 family)
VARQRAFGRVVGVLAAGDLGGLIPAAPTVLWGGGIPTGAGQRRT